MTSDDHLMVITSSLNRVISYARISLTDRCNFRCTYCMPECGVQEIAHDDIMRYEDILFLVQVLADIGIRKVRFTGGEPTVRRGFVDFIKSFRVRFPDIDLCLTTNGSTLAAISGDISEAGVSGINVSLDTIDDEKFAKITRSHDAASVKEGIRAAVKSGLNVKTNTVLIRGFNDEEAFDILSYVWDIGATPRFIEFMPLERGVWHEDSYIGAPEILEIFAKRIEISEEERPDSSDLSGPAKYYVQADTGRRFGVITAVSDHFCRKCNRLRFTAMGGLMPCLFSSDQIPLLKHIRERDGRALASSIIQGLNVKPKHWEDLSRDDTHMSSIGG